MRRAMVKSPPGLRGVFSSAVRSLVIACAVLALVCPGASARRPPGAVTTAATDIGATTATLNGIVTPYRTETTYQFRYGVNGYDAVTPLTSAGSGRGPVAVAAPVANLIPDTTYHAQLVAFGTRHVTTGLDVAFQTAPAPPPAAFSPALVPISPAAPGQQVLAAPPPVFGERVNVAVRQGIVTVKAPGGGSFVPLTDFASVPVGSMLNTRQGSVTLPARFPAGGTQSGIFHGGLSDLRQPKSGRGTTTLVLRGRPVSCRPWR